VCKLTLKLKNVQASTLFFENGEIAVTLPTAALPPLFRALGVHTRAELLSQQTPNFPWTHSDPSKEAFFLSSGMFLVLTGMQWVT